MTGKNGVVRDLDLVDVYLIAVEHPNAHKATFIGSGFLDCTYAEYVSPPFF